MADVMSHENTLLSRLHKLGWVGKLGWPTATIADGSSRLSYYNIYHKISFIVASRDRCDLTLANCSSPDDMLALCNTELNVISTNSRLNWMGHSCSCNKLTLESGRMSLRSYDR